ncbi:hypothetical protein [Mucilaginibacter terrae]|uniref:Uncharacterized protein n=1 Tax=Mucilaginibacter terrae TaxID=1955052 RepID=A0ABU3GXT1_9SPHI|nr:hypothetical protein [Mucilaginibacter terrae]MDT3404580.1 hypothetical protein [Mucilaginibacter terrae]
MIFTFVKKYYKVLSLIVILMVLKGKGTMLLGVFAGLITMTAAYFQWSEKDEASKKNKITQDELRQLNEETLKKTQELADAYKDNADLQKAISKKSDDIVEITKQLYTLSQQNAELQKELNNHVTGGGNFPILDFWTHSIEVTGKGKAFVAEFDLLNKGKYPLNHISYAITDFSGYEMMQFIRIARAPGGSYSVDSKPNSFYEQNFQNINTWQQSRIVGTLNVNQRYPLQSSVYRANGDKTPVIVFNITWNGGNVIYYITFNQDEDMLKLEKVSIILNGKSVEPGKHYVFKCHK